MKKSDWKKNSLQQYTTRELFFNPFQANVSFLLLFLMFSGGAKTEPLEKCPNTELFLVRISLLRKYQYSVQIQEHTDQK